MIVCECPVESFGDAPEWMYEPEELKARIHQPNQCPGDVDLAVYEREGRRLVLCSACCLAGDRRISENGITN